MGPFLFFHFAFYSIFGNLDHNRMSDVCGVHIHYLLILMENFVCTWTMTKKNCFDERFFHELGCGTSASDNSKPLRLIRHSSKNNDGSQGLSLPMQIISQRPLVCLCRHPKKSKKSRKLSKAWQKWPRLMRS